MSSRMESGEQPAHLVAGSGIKRFVTSEEWGQPPASQYQFRVDGTRMFGVLVSLRPSGTAQHHLAAIEAELAEDLHSWDALSDEALIEFEDTFD